MHLKAVLPWLFGLGLSALGWLGATCTSPALPPTGSILPAAPPQQTHLLADSPLSPTTPVKLIFIHHSTGGQWLAAANADQPYGGLGRALMDNNYFVSATNYGWGPGGIGDRTDIINWPEWFTGPTSATSLSALYSESGQNVGDFGAWPRLAADPGGENQVVLFKSCFPNSDLYGQPNDPPLAAPNDQFTVSNAKAVYNTLLAYFRTRPDKLFIVITAPPLSASEYSAGDQPAAERATNARAFNNWLRTDWLSGYPYQNVAVFDYYNVLTSNGTASRLDDPATNAEPNDLGTADGNHHRWRNSAIEFLQTVVNNFSAYPSAALDSHPAINGQLKATAEFVPWLNVAYNRWKGATPPGQSAQIYLPLVTRNYSTGPTAGTLVQPADLVYQGAFRLPDDAERPRTFAYGGGAMTFNPDGDPAGPADGFPGSLYIMGHDSIVGDLPDGSQLAEVSIPAPTVSTDLNSLTQAAFLQGFHDISQSFFASLDELPRVGLLYLNTPATGPKIHVAWGQHFQDAPYALPSHAWLSPNLAAPNLQGAWFIQGQSLYSVNGYLLEIPATWADQYASSRYIGTGRYRDGGWSGMGPALFAYRPWLADGSAPATGAQLENTPLLLYEKSTNTPNIERSLNSYQHADEWEGGAWLTTASGKTAVLFAGTKGTGAKYWYGWINPAGPAYPCIETELVDQFTTCRLADGTPCPQSDLGGCTGHSDYRGWWSSRFDAEFILYNPADLAKVAAGQLQAWEPQPYATMDLDNRLFLNPAGIEPGMLGAGDQQRFRLGDVAYDRTHGRLYVLELFADNAKPVVHVWKVQ